MEYMAWVCYLNAFFLVADITIYPRDGVNVPNPSTNPRLRYMRSLRYVLPNSSPGIIDAGSSTLDLSIERLTRENQNTRLISLPSGQIYDGRGAIRQELPGVDSRRLQPVEYGYLGSDGPAIESARQRRANSRILSPRRRTREHIQSRRVPRLSLSQIQTRRLSQMGAPRLLDINQNYYHNQDTTVLRYPGQTTHRRSAVLRTGAPRQLRTRRQRLSAQIGSPSRSSRSDLRTPLRANQRRAPSYPLSRGQIRNIPVRH